MPTIAELRQTKASKVSEAKLAVDDPTKYDALKAEIDGLDTAIKDGVQAELDATKRRDQLAAWDKELAAVLPRRSTPDPIVGSVPARAKDPNDKPFKTLGAQLMAIAQADSQRASVETMNRLNAVYELAPSGAAAANPADGGFLIQHDLITEIMTRTYDSGQIASRVKRMEVGPNSNGIKLPATGETSRATGSRWGGVQTYWGSEGNAPTAKKPSLRYTEINLGRLTGLMYATDELLADAQAMESYSQLAFQAEIEFAVEDAILNGDGTGKPKGITVSNALVSVSKETGQAAATIVKENIDNMWARMWAPSRANAVWLVNQNVEPQLASLGQVIGVGGLPVYLPPGGLSVAPYSTLKGRPVIPVEYCATLGTVGDIMLVDLSQYILIEKGGVQTASSMHVNFTTAEMAYRFIYRVGGQTWWSAALTPKAGSTLSPFVVLATRS